MPYYIFSEQGHISASKGVKMIYQTRNRPTIGTAIAVAFLLLSPKAALATNAEDATEGQTAATTMVEEAGDAAKKFNKEEPVYNAAKKLRAATEEWKQKAADWKTKADEWSNTPDNKSKRDAAKTTKEEADDAKGKYDEALAALSKARGQDKATFQSDYSAKHFSLVLGAVVLNPFKLESVDTDMDPTTSEFRVENGNPDANALLEAGFRRRWAWENWENASLRDESRKLQAIETQLSAEESKPKKHQVAKRITDWKDEADKSRQKIGDLRTQYSVDKVDWHFTFLERADEYPENWTKSLKLAGDLLVPRNFAVRLGFALRSDQPSGAAAVAGAGDFYIETGIGTDWVRVLYPTGGEPLRVAFGPELFLSFNNASEPGRSGT